MNMPDGNGTITTMTDQLKEDYGSLRLFCLSHEDDFVLKSHRDSFFVTLKKRNNSNNNNNNDDDSNTNTNSAPNNNDGNKDEEEFHVLRNNKSECKCLKSVTENKQKQKQTKKSASRREDLITDEIKKCKNYRVKDLRMELANLSIDTSTFLEKSEFVRALAEARIPRIVDEEEEEEEEEEDEEPAVVVCPDEQNNINNGNCGAANNDDYYHVTSTGDEDIIIEEHQKDHDPREEAVDMNLPQNCTCNCNLEELECMSIAADKEKEEEEEGPGDNNANCQNLAAAASLEIDDTSTMRSVTPPPICMLDDDSSSCSTEQQRVEEEQAQYDTIPIPVVAVSTTEIKNDDDATAVAGDNDDDGGGYLSYLAGMQQQSALGKSKNGSCKKRRNKSKKKGGSGKNKKRSSKQNKELTANENVEEMIAPLLQKTNHQQSALNKKSQPIINPVVSGLPTRKQSKVQFSQVFVREYARCIGYSTVPSDGSWSLGLSSEIVLELEDDIDAFEHRREIELRERMCNILQSNNKKGAVDNSMSKDAAVLETRQFDYRRGVRNPLFKNVPEGERQDTLLAALDPDHHHENHAGQRRSTRRQRKRGLSQADLEEMRGSSSGATIEMELEHEATLLRTELEHIRDERSENGCSCQKLKHVNKLSERRMRDELRRRHLDTSGKKDALSARLKAAIDSEPCCSKNCPCAQAGVNCQADICSCWRGGKNGRVTKEALESCRERCGNIHGMYVYDPDLVRLRRKPFLCAVAKE